ncbi:MAG: elongation factor G [Defluviitaleaceae bacterium]|nr:elongation factor G [Defluviitaleaceae bacterium]
MKCYSSNEIRNVAVLGHSGCGKTSLVEAFLNVSGVTSRLGKVDDGNTVSDYDAEEIRRKVSVSSSVIPVEWNGGKINFIDTPGYFDFAGQVREALSVADLLLIVVSAKSGVEVGSEIAWDYAEEMDLPRMIFVNGMDDENADMDKVVEELKEKFGKSIAPIQIPIKEGGKFVGYINVVKKAGRKFDGTKTTDCDVPAALADELDTIRHMVEEAVAETDDSLMEKFFEEEPFTVDEIFTGIQSGVAAHMVTPVLCGSATTSLGSVSGLLDAIVNSTPPTSKLRPSTKATDVKSGGEIEVKCDESEPLSLFVFKTIADPYVGRLTIFKVVSGVLKKDAQLFNVNKDSEEKASTLYVLRGKEQIEVSELRAGDIGALAKLQNAGTSHTLCAKSRPVRFAEVKFPVPLLSMAIMPKSKGDEDKIGQAMTKLMEEDRTLKFAVNAVTKQSVVSALGDNQLDVLVNKLRNRHKLEVNLIVPTIQYREMIKGKVKVQGRHKKQSGGRGQFGDVHMEFEPSGDLTQPYVFESEIVGGVVPKQYFPAIEKGIQECVTAGPLAGYPVVGIKTTLVDGSYHDVDSSEMAFKLAAIIAFKEAFVKAKPAILEPIAKIVVSVPDDYTGDIMGDMNKRRGRVLGMEKSGKKTNISAEAPMAEMFKYTTDLRSMTQGRGSFVMEFDRYEEAPAEVQTKVVEIRKKELEKEKE